MLIAQLPQAAQEVVRDDTDAALHLHGLDHDRSRLGHDSLGDRVEVVARELIEALDLRSEALEVLGVAAGGERRQGTAVEGALEGDDAEPLGLTIGCVILARDLDRALAGFGAGVAEEDTIGERPLDESLSEPLLILRSP